MYWLEDRYQCIYCPSNKLYPDGKTCDFDPPKISNLEVNVTETPPTTCDGTGLGIHYIGSVQCFANANCESGAFHIGRQIDANNFKGDLGFAGTRWHCVQDDGGNWVVMKGGFGGLPIGTSVPWTCTNPEGETDTIEVSCP